MFKDLPRSGCNNLTKMLVAVRGIPNDFESRKWIRNNYGKFRSNDTALIFLLGNAKVSEI